MPETLPTMFVPYQTQEFQKFYTDAEEIRSLMQTLLGPIDGAKILEPCVGRGAFLSNLCGIPAIVDAVDIDETHITQLRAASWPWLNTIHSDFINDWVEDDFFSIRKYQHCYDGVICNPPYGLDFSLPYRRKLKKCFPNLYVRESYGLFMHFGIRSLRNGGRYVFIVPDTFLTSRNHKPLREFLVSEGKPTHVIRFPSKRFQTVNFGYGRLCIIAGYRASLTKDDGVLWVDNVEEEKSISYDLFNNITPVPGSLILKHTANGWVHPSKHKAICMDVPSTLLGEIAECRTGIYTGNNSRYCGFDSNNPPVRQNGHPIDRGRQVKMSPLTESEKTNGLQREQCYVPLIRGGHRDPFAKTVWALNWSPEALNAYATDKKARLQNRTFYFREGLAVPMVTSGRLSASLMSGAIFDQGVVGIFPHDSTWLDYLLIYFNSNFVSETVKAVLNPGANNSANYIKRIPIAKPSDGHLAKARDIIRKARKYGWEETKYARDAFMEELLRKK